MITFVVRVPCLSSLVARIYFYNYAFLSIAYNYIKLSHCVWTFVFNQSCFIKKKKLIFYYKIKLKKFILLKEIVNIK